MGRCAKSVRGGTFRVYRRIRADVRPLREVMEAYGVELRSEEEALPPEDTNC